MRVTAHTKAGDDKAEFDTANTHNTHTEQQQQQEQQLPKQPKAKAAKNIEKPIRKQLEKAMAATAKRGVVLTVSFNPSKQKLDRVYYK